MGNFYHFREPESARCKACFEKPGIVRPSDFLDPIAEDSPSGVWYDVVLCKLFLSICMDMVSCGYY